MMCNRVLLAAGGTGGHVFPAIAIGTALHETGCHVQFHTDKRGALLLATRPALCDAFSVKIVAAASPFTGNVLRRSLAMLKLIFGTCQAGAQMMRSRPQMVLGFGGYASAPSLLAASLLRIPAALHEQNSRIGRANRLLARLCGHLILTWQNSHPLPAATNIRIAGLPVDASLYQIADQPLRQPHETLRLHIQGGSLGAHIFGRIVPEAIAQLPEALRQRIELSQQVRADEINRVKARYQELGIHAEIASFFHDIPERLAKADLVISRSGAASVAEIAAAGRAAVFIPFAAALDDHQTANAKALTSVGGGAILPESQATPPALAELLLSLLNAPQSLSDMGRAARTASQTDATKTILALIQELAKNKTWSGK